jgi:uncharacterized membrane protein YraQ (UPF0718 family)/copper chaperone CopZ
MGKRNLKSVLYGTLLGIPLPLCSCGVIPTGVSFYKEGASRGATVSFLISTPQTGVDSILATYSLLGLPFAILRPIVALFSGILGGAVTNSRLREEPEEAPKAEIKHVAVQQSGKFRTMMRYAFDEFLMDIAKWLIIGLAIAAFIALVLPDDFFTAYLQYEWMSMLLVLAASIPIYVCATGSIPIAAVLMMKGLSPGAALVFLMAGPATNTATMAVIGKAIGKKTLVLYLSTIIGSALLFGFLTNLFLPSEWFTGMISTHESHQHEFLPGWLKISSAIVLSFLIAAGYYRKYFSKRKTKKQITSDMSTSVKNLRLAVEGMTCSHCKANVEKHLGQLDGIQLVTADPETNEVQISGENPDVERIQSEIEKIGYRYKGVLS